MLVGEKVPNSNDRPELSIIIPVYNQQKEISKCFSELEKNIHRITDNYEVIIVNDGSTDNTPEILHNIQERHVTICDHKKNMGKGSAIKTGIRKSKGDAVLFLDGDGEISSDDLIPYIDALKNSDIAIGSKRHADSKVSAPMSRKFLSYGFNCLVRFLTGINISDTQAGLKVGKGDVMRIIVDKMTIKRYAFDVEFLTIASLLDMKISEMPVNISLDRKFLFKDIFRMLRDLIVISYRHRILHFYEKQFDREQLT